MYIPELFFRLEWLEMDVLDELAMGTVDRDRCRLNQVQLAVLPNYELLLRNDPTNAVTSHGNDRMSCTEP